MKKIEDVLIQRGYCQKDAQSVVSQIKSLSSVLIPIFNIWIATGEESDYIVGEYSLASLKRKFQMTYPAALLTIDWLIKDPINASLAIKKGIR